MGGQATAMTGDLGAVTGDGHLVERDRDIDSSADEAGVDRVVVGVDPHVVITGQPDAVNRQRHIRQQSPAGPASIRGLRRSPQRVVDPGRGVNPHVGSLRQPADQLAR